MSKVLDLNAVQNSIMDVTLQDEARTVVHLDYPTEELVQELEALLPELHKIENGDRAAVEMTYDLAARLINCNYDFLKVTGQELRTKYRMTLYSAIIFFKGYLSFIESLHNEKN